jgi:hypothetical protein
MITKLQKMLRPIEMLASTDQDIKNLVPNEQGWIKIKVNHVRIILHFFTSLKKLTFMK